MYCSNSKSPAAFASAPVVGALVAKMYSPRAPRRFTVHGRSNSLIDASTPSDQRVPKSIIRSKFSWVNTCVNVARIDASDKALPANVPPIPPVSIISNSTILFIESAIAAVIPYVPVGIPPAMALPIVKKSGFKPRSAVIPPGPTDIVWVSSMIKRDPYFLANSCTASK